MIFHLKTLKKKQFKQKINTPSSSYIYWCCLATKAMKVNSGMGGGVKGHGKAKVFLLKL